MSIEPVWMETVIPAAAVGLATILLMAVVLGWWRNRLDGEDTRSIRARIIEAAPVASLPAPSASQPPRRSIQPKSRSDLGQRNLLASSFIGRDRNATPID